ncbi:MAG: glycosyltransferase family 2 protein [Betaproteobacteria bacterium]|nr:glycosyltransferase family 2 protein [Betaproteobacteria bacterium]
MPRLELTILMPCLNEAETLADCVRKAKDYLARSGIEGEVLVADNGSSDGSPAIAQAHGARVVAVAAPGYGSALKGGIDSAQGRYIIMGDADGSYDFAALDAFVAKLREGCDLVMGNRFAGGIAPGAMPFLHRYLGNPVLSFLGRLFFGSSVRDFHCGLRGFSKAAIAGLDLRTTGMEFASEMVVKSILRGLKIAEVPTTLAPDGRSRPPHLRTWRDGWRHLRFLLLFSPHWLFLVPGLGMTCAGTLAMAALIPGPLPVGSVVFDIHTMLYAGGAVIVGLQICGFAVFSKVVAMVAGLVPPDPGTEAIVRQASLERGLVFGGILAMIGVAGALYGVLEWRAAEFGPLVATSMMRVAIPSLTVLAAGVQVMFASFFLSTLRLIPR